MSAPRIGDFSAAERNKEAIFAVLSPWLKDAVRVLEVGAGDATHACHAVACLAHIVWQTSEAPGHYRRLTAALAERNHLPGAERLPPPLALDVRGRWPQGPFDAVYGANVAHIMDWAAVEALFAGAAGVLAEGGLLCLYGPFLREGVRPEPGNAAFDHTLRARDPAMGLRTIEALDRLAIRDGLAPVADAAMPSDNRLLLWRRAAGVGPASPPG